MKIAEFHSHLNGYEWLILRRAGMWESIERMINAVDATRFRTKVSKEKTMKGKLLYSPKKVNSYLAEKFAADGWSERRSGYWVTDDIDLIRTTLGLPPGDQKKLIEAAGKKAIGSYTQTDFVKERVAVEVQFGKYTFISYDLFVKHMAFYVGNEIDLGIEILPMKSMQQEMSSGPGYYEGTLHIIARQGRGVPAVPLVIIGVEP
jgi:restriction endonuclease BglII